MIALERGPQRFCLTAPASFYDLQAVEAAVRHCRDVSACSCTLTSARSDHVAIEVTSEEVLQDAAVRRLFGRIHRVPDVSGGPASPAHGSHAPLLSCVIVLTANDLFVRHALIPSILRYTPRVPLEIIVVHNGLGVDPALFDDVSCIASEYGCVSKAYNHGVEAASGRYVALFHDDCMLTDASWFETCVRLIDEGCAAVSPEFRTRDRLTVAKAVPLVLKRQTYLDLGGHDAAYYVGIEDLDFTYQILSRGGSVGRADVGSLHFNGMSTVIVNSTRPVLFSKLFGYHALPRHVVAAFAALHLKNLRKERVFNAMLERDYDYFFSKFESYFGDGRHAPALALRDRYRRRLKARALLDPATMATLADRSRLVQYFKKRHLSKQRAAA